MLILESSEGTLVMSGDVSMSEQRTVKSVEVPRIKADALVLESTYGGKLHANRVAEEKRLMQTLQRVTERGGKVLIPAFALGRSQEVIQIIHAFRDQFDVPVFVDGMVRSVCDAYARFADLLPPRTVKMAGDDHLFFRNKVKPIRSNEHRQEVARSAALCVVVASSGMLTGGASVVYAEHFAPEERNAILLTGYQDEEAPGRFLQRIMREQEQGETPVLSLGDKKVKVRCELGTYSLSAHADESELISIAEAFKPQEIMLVHGDEGPRHSIATGLRQRQRITTTPRIGTERTFAFQSKPWAIGAKVKSGGHTGEVELRELWNSLKDQAGSYFSSRELAQVWWGDGERAKEMAIRLDQQDNVYFAADWRNKTTFRVNSQGQVDAALRRRAIMLANPDIVGKLIVLRNSNDQPRLGVVKSADIDSFEAIVQGAKGSRNPADALLWVVGDWDGVEGVEGSVKTQLTALMKNARAQIDVLFPYSKRLELVEAGQAVTPESLLPETLPEGVDRQTALVAIILGLAEDGATLEQNGLKPQRALQSGPLEQNEARELALTFFPPEARLRKVGLDVHRKRLLLSFDFPQAAERAYADRIEELIEQTGWNVQVKPQVNQGALAMALNELLPAGASISKGPSYYMDKREVQAEISGLDDTSDLEANFLRMTDFRLVTSRKGDSAPTPEAVVAPASSEQGEQMEINAAYALVREVLEPRGLYKVGLKQGQLVLSFISPQVGERCTEEITSLAKKTGYSMSIHPHPNQQQIIQVAQRLVSGAGWQVQKGPSIHVDRATIGFKLLVSPPDAEVEEVAAALEEKTGYSLEIST